MMRSRDFFQKYFDLEYYVSTGFRVRKDDGAIELFLVAESEGKTLELVYAVLEGEL